MYGAKRILILGIERLPIVDTDVAVSVGRWPRENVGSGRDAIASIFSKGKLVGSLVQPLIYQDKCMKPKDQSNTGQKC